MGQVRVAEPVLLVAAVFSRHGEALAWVADRLADTFGPIALISLPFWFNQTHYYDADMGTDLRKMFLFFQDLVPQDCLPRVKHLTNRLEEDLAGSGRFAERRPLNIDPGLLSLGKFLLASTKDNAHRIYLHDGIFAEVTLRFHGKAFEPWPWTYADYREPCVLACLREARDYYRRRRREVVSGA